MSAKTTIMLDPETAGRIREKVESGEFAAARDVVRAALDSLDRGALSTAQLRQMVEDADSDPTDYSAEEVGAHLDRLHRELSAKFST